LISAGRIFASAIFFVPALSPAYADGPSITRVLKQAPDLDGFDFCHGGGCARIASVRLSAGEWQLVEDIYKPAPETAEAERDYIASAIGLMEKIVGVKTGTDTDRAGTFGNAHIPGQLDCNDESANTTTYMKLMRQAGLIRFHEIMDTKTRNFFFNGWPHTTAVIREKRSDRSAGARYAVDSWFYDNGVPPVIIPLTDWQSGWKPDNTAAR
jgi:hypothetical protein